jgi:hypothetical protein
MQPKVKGNEATRNTAASCKLQAASEYRKQPKSQRGNEATRHKGNKEYKMHTCAATRLLRQPADSAGEA